MSQLGLAFPARFSTRRQIHRTLSVMVAFALFTLGLATAPMALADPTSPLTVTNIASPTPVASGAEITYTITIVNTGGSKVTNLVLADQLNGVGTLQSPPATPQYAVASSQGTCSQSGQLVTCNGGNLAGGASWTVTIRGLVTAPNGTTINNTATITGTRSAQNFTTNASAQTLVQGGTGGGTLPDLTINKTGPTSVVAGAAFDYVLTVNNPSTLATSNVAVTDTLPAGVTLTSITTTSLFTCSPSSGTGVTVVCTGGSVNAGQNAAITLHVTAPAVAGGSLTNTAAVDPDNTIAESNELNNTSATVNTSVTTANAAPPLSIVKTDDPAIIAGSVITYVLTVTNEGTDPAFGVTVRDTLPAGTSFISADDQTPGATQFTCSVNGHVITCSGATLSGTVTTLPGAPATRTIVITAFAPNRPMIVTNTAYVDPDNTIPEGDETDNAASASTVVTVGAGFIDLSITTCDGGPCPTVGNPVPMNTPITYAVTVTNNGTDPAFQVTVRDILPAGATFLSAVDQAGGAGSFACSASDGVVTCIGGTLDGSLDLIGGVPTERVILISVMPPQQHGLVITNQAFVDPANAIAESNETNNYAVDTSLVISPFDVSLTKEGPTTAHQNNNEDYTITVTNNGAAVNDVLVEDALPTGLIVLGVTATPANFTCQVFENPVNVVRCVGDMGATGSDTATVTITVTVFVTADGGTLDNEACVDPDNAIVESDEANNCATKSSVVDVFRPNIVVHKSASVGSATIGQAFAYDITVANIGDAPAAAGWTVEDTLPSAVDFVAASGNNGGTCTESSGTVTCTPLALAPGAQETYTIQVRANTTATSAFTNTAALNGTVDADPAVAPCDSSTCGPETSVANNSDSVTVSSGGPSINLVVGDISDLPDPAEQGDQVVYTVVVTNGGTQDALAADGREVVVRITVPTVGVTLGAPVGSQGFVCVASTGDSIVTCTGDLNGGESTVLSIPLLTTGTTPPSLEVTVTADPTNAIAETDETDNTASETTTVTSSHCTSCIDLVMGQIGADPTPGVDGGQVTYKFAVTNIGDLSTATDPDPLVVAINLDTTFNRSSFSSSSATNGLSCVVNPFFGSGLGQSTANPEVLCTASASGLNPGQGTLITIVANVNTASTPSSVDFGVAVDPDNVVAEDSDANNTGSLQIDVVAP